MERDEQGHVHPPAGADEGPTRSTPEPSGPAPERVVPDPSAGGPLAPGAAASEPPAAAPASGAAEGAGDAEMEGHHLLELWSDREEIHALPDILRPAEGLVAVGSGTVVRSGRLAQSKWLVVLTDRRLLCLKGRAAVTRKVIDMPVSQIRGVESKGWFRKTMSLDTGYGTLRISGVKKGVAAQMADGLTTLMGSYSEGGDSKTTAIPRADLSKAGMGGAGQSKEELHALGESVEQLRETVGELKDRIAFLEELVRSNVGSE